MEKERREKSGEQNQDSSTTESRTSNGKHEEEPIYREGFKKVWKKQTQY
jgi:hypothetical protein